MSHFTDPLPAPLPAKQVLTHISQLWSPFPSVFTQPRAILGGLQKPRVVEEAEGKEGRKPLAPAPVSPATVSLWHNPRLSDSQLESGSVHAPQERKAVKNLAGLRVVFK